MMVFRLSNKGRFDRSFPRGYGRALLVEYGVWIKGNGNDFPKTFYVRALPYLMYKVTVGPSRKIPLRFGYVVEPSYICLIK